MADTFGDSFSPLQPPGGPGGTNPGGFGSAGGSPIQDAIKILSLRIPRVVGASALAPMGLLNGPGGSMFGGGALDAYLQHVFGQRRGAHAGPVAAMPMPHETPGPSRPSPPVPNVVYTPPDRRTSPDGGPQLPPPAGPSMPMRPPDRMNRGRL